MKNDRTGLRDLRREEILERPPKILSLKMRRDLAAPKILLKESLRITQKRQENSNLFLGNDDLFSHRPRNERYMVDKRGQQVVATPTDKQYIKSARPKWPSKEKAAQETYERLCTTQEKQK